MSHLRGHGVRVATRVSTSHLATSTFQSESGGPTIRRQARTGSAGRDGKLDDAMHDQEIASTNVNLDGSLRVLPFQTDRK